MHWLPDPASRKFSFRRRHVQRAGNGVAFFAFDELCSDSHGAADYHALARAFKTIFVAGVPEMGSKARDQARRFITLVDELYNAKTQLVCSAAAPPQQLFKDPLAYQANVQELEVLDELRQNLFVAVPQWCASFPATVGHAWRRPSPRLGRNREKHSGYLVSAQEASFMFQRAVSRLLEMGALGARPPS